MGITNTYICIEWFLNNCESRFGTLSSQRELKFELSKYKVLHEFQNIITNGK